MKRLFGSEGVRGGAMFAGLCLGLAAGVGLRCAAGDAENGAPYPPSPVFAGIRFDKATWVRAAPGSDQFGTTWASDGNLYTAWGDGGGFGGTNRRGRVSLGVARIRGIPPHWRARNVWGGVAPASVQKPILGKTAGGVLAAAGVLYLYVVEQGVWTRNHLWKSADFGRTWQDLGLLFHEAGAAFANVGIVQFGPGYSGARDGFVYGYSEKPFKTGLALFRVPKERLADRAAYRFFAGLDAAGAPRWTADIARQAPVFQDPRWTEWGVTCAYHPVYRRYLLSVRHHGDSGEWGLFDAPEPWGPWTTVGYGSDFPAWTWRPDPHGASPGRPAWMHTFPVKWMAADGRSMWQISDRGDQFNLVRVRIRRRGRR